MNKNILVAGDCMLDRYLIGVATRISPEAPVPVVLINKEETRLGGAANLALNIRTLGDEVSLMSVVGKDAEGDQIVAKLKENGIGDKLYRDSSIHTTVKIRIMAQNQQLLRMDYETEPCKEILMALLDEFNKILDDVSVLVLSDYAKGGLRHIKAMIENAKSKGIPVLIDPKGKNR